MWDLPKEYCWATAGYLGAIASGETTCGLLIGSSIAVGFRQGIGEAGVPKENMGNRGKAIQVVGSLYKDFLKEFGSTHCQTLTSINFSKKEEIKKYLDEKIYEKKCGMFLEFVMNRFINMTKEEQV